MRMQPPTHRGLRPTYEKVSAVILDELAMQIVGFMVNMAAVTSVVLAMQVVAYMVRARPFRAALFTERLHLLTALA